MILNRIGVIAKQELELLSQRFTNIELNIFQIMPNHIHAIIIIREQKPQINLGTIIGAYKSLVTIKCLPLFAERNVQMGKFWQRSYYDHIIRNYKSYRNIYDYIVENPIHWLNDELYTP